MMTALDGLHSEVGLNQERESTKKALRRGECLQRRAQRKRQLRTVESADGEDNVKVRLKYINVYCLRVFS